MTAEPWVSTEELAARVVDGVDSVTARRLIVHRACEIEPQEVRWAWAGRIPLGAVTLLAGREGVGKSLVAVDLAAQVTLGALAGDLAGSPRDVLYVASEDDLATTVVPRLHRAGADVGRVHVLEGVASGSDVEFLDWLSLPRDLDLIAELVAREEIALVVLDAATSTMDGSFDGNSDRQMRRALEPLSRMARVTGVAVAGIVHFGKKETADVGRLILGSIAWSQVARSVLAFASDAHGEGFVVTAAKANLGPPVPSLAARIVDGDVPSIEWLGETSSDARDLLAPVAPAERGKGTAVAEAYSWLVEYLAAQPQGQALKTDLQQAARSAGHSWSSVHRAKDQPGSGVTFRNEGFPKITVWYLDEGTFARATREQSSHQSSHERLNNRAGHTQSSQSSQSFPYEPGRGIGGAH